MSPLRWTYAALAEAFTTLAVWLPILVVATLLLLGLYGGVGQLEAATGGATHYVLPEDAASVPPSQG